MNLNFNVTYLCNTLPALWCTKDFRRGKVVLKKESLIIIVLLWTLPHYLIPKCIVHLRRL